MSDAPFASDVHGRLCTAAVALFDERGYDATSVNDVVGRAGVTKGAFYHYFNSKADCLQELHRTFVEDELERLESAVQLSTSAADAIRRIVRAFLYGVHKNHAMARIFDHEWRHVESTGFEAILIQRDRIAAIVVEQVQRGMDGGEFVVTRAPTVLALAIIGMCGWAHRWYDASGSLAYDEIADLWSSNFLEGILVRPERS